MTDPAGKLHIRLGPGSASIASTRPVRAAGLFVGRGLSETGRLLPAMFSVCASAQSAACAAACEQALGRTADPRVQGRRARLVAAETLREHLWRILLDWPRFLGEPPDSPAMARAMAGYAAWRDALTAGLDLFAPGAALTAMAPAPPWDMNVAGAVAVPHPSPARGEGESERAPGASFTVTGARAAPAEAVARQALSELCAHAVFGAAPGPWLARVNTLAALRDWTAATDTAAARLLGHVLAAGHAALGRAPIAALPVLTAGDLEAHLAGLGPAADTFVARPTWEGLPRETSALTRQHAAPLVRDLGAHFGNGLLTRLAAQLTEAARLLATDASATARPAAADRLPPGVGLAQVPAARGLLVHRVRLTGERISEYRILAPTEWNFHPDGVVAAGLTGLWEHAEPADPVPLARLFITAVDPCVTFDLQLPPGHQAQPSGPPDDPSRPGDA